MTSQDKNRERQPHLWTQILPIPIERLNGGGYIGDRIAARGL